MERRAAWWTTRLADPAWLSPEWSEKLEKSPKGLENPAQDRIVRRSSFWPASEHVVSVRSLGR